MGRVEQYLINCEAYYIWQEAMHQWLLEYGDAPSKKLRSCNAVVYETSDYYVLKSYDTLIAVIVKENYILIDMLRHEYHFTNTSAQHITKFRHDYTPYPWNYPVLTWRKLK